VSKTWDSIAIGAGAASYFYAINFKLKNPDKSVLILEQSNKTLSKVRISGGGRCNVTHACFEPKELVKFYPRGARELLGPFHKFQPGDTIAWFAEHGVELKIEEDGRMFPVLNSSQSIVDCFENLAKNLGIKLNLNSKIDQILPQKGKVFLETYTKESYECRNLFLGAGSSKILWKVFKELGCKLIDPVPSLFTFNCKDKRIRDLMGLSLANVEVKIPKLKVAETGPLLITHWGMSGPGILKLSAQSARELADVNYHFSVKINSCYPYKQNEIEEELLRNKKLLINERIDKNPILKLPKRWWLKNLEFAGIGQEAYRDLSDKKLRLLAESLCSGQYSVNGKSTFKEEFVTAGGLDLKEIDWKTMRLKKYPNIQAAGEFLNVDALTGGFNFQAAWTGAWIAAQH
jgi:predicted Rossmann fold flavoprotein